MKKRIIIRDNSLKDRAKHMIDRIPDDVVHEVVIKPHRTSRSVQQNALYWLWVTIIAEECGETKEDTHSFNKKRFAVPIFTRDDPDGYGLMISQVMAVPDELSQNVLLDQVANLTSTTKFTITQMREFLTDVDRFAITIGVLLPIPKHLNLMIKDHRTR